MPRVHARLDDLERDASPDRRDLFGHEDDAHASLADLLEELVRTDACSCEFAVQFSGRGVENLYRRFQEAADLFVRFQKRFGLGPQILIAGAGSLKKC